MRASRTLSGLAAIVLLLATSSAVLSQAPEPTTMPLGRQPDGSLPLEGTPWRLQSYSHKGRIAAPGPEVAATLRLTSGRFDATGGCSRFAGAYDTLGSAIAFRPGRVKPPTCAEQSAIVQLALVSGLRKAASFELVAAEDADARLVLRSTGGEELLRLGLDDVASLEGSTWTLAAYVVDGVEQPASSEQTAILTFVPERNARVRRRSSGQVTG
jgi:heat shock protein HslJ